MVGTIFYSGCLLASLLINLLINRSKTRNISLGIVLLTQYFVISVFSIIIIRKNLMYLPEITFLPFVILLISYTITFRPFLSNKNNFNASKIEIAYDNVYNYLIFLYIGFAIISIFIYLPHIKELITENSWAMQRNMYYTGSVDKIYNNFFERIALNYVGYFSNVALILYFIFLKNNYNPKLRMTLLITILASNLLSGMQNASRGMIYNLFVLFIAMYLFFRSTLSEKNKRKMIIFLILIGSVFFIYSIVVTISRFSQSTNFDVNSMQSVIEYFGQAPLVFNYGVFPVSEHTYGIYSFGKLFELFGAQISYPMYEIGGMWDGGFFTYVGLTYIDFGIMGVIIHSLIIYYVLTYLLRKNKFKVSNMYLIFTIYQYLLDGAFVIGTSYIISFIMNVCIFVFLHVIESIKQANAVKPSMNMQ